MILIGYLKVQDYCLSDTCSIFSGSEHHDNIIPPLSKEIDRPFLLEETLKVLLLGMVSYKQGLSFSFKKQRYLFVTTFRSTLNIFAAN